MKPRLSLSGDPYADPFTPMRDAASAAVNNLGLTIEPQQVSPEHWQRVLAAVEARMQMRGVEFPEGWRKELAVHMGRADPSALSGTAEP